MVMTQKENTTNVSAVLKLKWRRTGSAWRKSTRTPKKYVELGTNVLPVSRTGKHWRTLRQRLQQNPNLDLDRLFFWNLISGCQDDDPKEQFLGYMNKWLTDSLKTNDKPKRPSPQITNSSNIASSMCGVSSLFNLTVTVSTACSSVPKPPASHSPTLFQVSVDVEDESPAVLLDDDDTVEREAAHSVSNMHKAPAVVSQLALTREESIDYCQPPFTQRPKVTSTSIKTEPIDVSMDTILDVSSSNDYPIIINVPPVATTTLAGRKWATTIQAADHRKAPLSKHPCTKPSSVQDKTGVECTTRKVKYNNSHLP
ncbi:hypothetical protein EV363DRAFT_1297800 [Boletus edulis]|nr:hypothetical protein EV363DRAFT_1297800 [Boletus edulis]